MHFLQLQRFIVKGSKNMFTKEMCALLLFLEKTHLVEGRDYLNNQNFFLQQHYLTAILCIKTISNIANGNSIPICISTKNMQIKSSIIYNVPKISFITKLEHIFITIQNFNLYHRTFGKSHKSFLYRNSINVRKNFLAIVNVDHGMS